MIRFDGIQQSATSAHKLFTYAVDFADLSTNLVPALVDDIQKKVADTIAEEFLKQNMADILKKLDSQTILNLALAKSAARVFDSVKS